MRQRFSKLYSGKSGFGDLRLGLALIAILVLSSSEPLRPGLHSSSRPGERSNGVPQEALLLTPRD